MRSFKGGAVHASTEPDGSKLPNLSTSQKRVSRSSSEQLRLENLLKHMQSDSTPLECNLSNLSLDNDDVKQLFSVLSRNVSIDRIILQNTNLGASSGEQIATCLTSNMRLSSFDVSHNALGVRGLKQLCRFLAHNETLEALNLGWNNLIDTDNVHGVDISGIETLAESLGGTSSLQSLSLEGNYITDYGTNLKSLYSLTEAVAGSNSLVDLDLSSNGLGASGAKVLSEGLRMAPVLKRLRLSRNRFRSKGCWYISKLVAGNHKLELLDLSENELTNRGEDDSGLLALAKVFKLQIRNSKKSTEEDALNDEREEQSRELWDVSYCVFQNQDDGITCYDLRIPWLDRDHVKAESKEGVTNHKLQSTTISFEIPMFTEATEPNKNNSKLSMLSGNSTLTTLNLRGNVITKAVAQEFAESLRYNYSILSIQTGPILDPHELEGKTLGLWSSGGNSNLPTRDTDRSCDATLVRPSRGSNVWQTSEKSERNNWITPEVDRILQLVITRTHANKMAKKLLCLFETNQARTWSTCCDPNTHSTPIHLCVKAGSNVTLSRILSFLQAEDIHVHNLRNEETMVSQCLSTEILAATDSMRRLALHYAVSNRDGIMVNMLLQVGSDVNAVDRDGNSPMHIATGATSHGVGDLAITCLLCEHGASLTLMNKHGQLPLDCNPFQHFRDEVLSRECRTDIIILCTSDQHECLCANEVAFALQDLNSESSLDLTIEVVALDEYSDLLFTKPAGSASQRKKTSTKDSKEKSHGAKLVESLLNFSLEPSYARHNSLVDGAHTVPSHGLLSSDHHTRCTLNINDTGNGKDKERIPAEPLAEDEATWLRVCEAGIVVFLAGPKSVESMRCFRILSKMYHSKPVCLGASKTSPVASVSLRSKLCCVLLQPDLNPSQDTFDNLLDNMPGCDLPDVFDKVTGDLNPGLTIDDVHCEAVELLRPFHSRAVARQNHLRQDRLHYLASMSGLPGDLFILDSLVNAGGPFAMVLTGGCPGGEVSRATQVIQDELAKQNLACWTESTLCDGYHRSRIEEAIPYASSILLVVADYDTYVVNRNQFVMSQSSPPSGANNSRESSTSQSNLKNGSQWKNTFTIENQTRIDMNYDEEKKDIEQIVSRYVEVAKNHTIPIVPIVFSCYTIPSTLSETLQQGSISLHLQPYNTVRTKLRSSKLKVRLREHDNNFETWKDDLRCHKSGLEFPGNINGMAKLVRQQFVLHSTRTRQRLAALGARQELVPKSFEQTPEKQTQAQNEEPNNNITQDGSNTDINKKQVDSIDTTLPRLKSSRSSRGLLHQIEEPIPAPKPCEEWITRSNYLFERFQIELFQYHKLAHKSVSQRDETIGLASDTLQRVEEHVISSDISKSELIYLLAQAQDTISNLQGTVRNQNQQLDKLRILNSDYRLGLERMKEKLLQEEMMRMATYPSFASVSMKSKSEESPKNSVSRVSIHHSRARRRRLSKAEEDAARSIQKDVERITQLKESLENRVEDMVKMTSSKSFRRARSSRRVIGVPASKNSGIVMVRPQSKDGNSRNNDEELMQQPLAKRVEREIADLTGNILRREKALAALSFQRIWRGVCGRRKAKHVHESQNARRIQKAWRTYKSRAQAWSL